ncbi:MAG: DUF5915 domain-containing protein, partial [Actinomycetota bacterium]|nr:DUF5915 domain-containing protein [Actinomycetota bacterium]
GDDVAVHPDEVVVTETPREGWAVAAAGGETVALDLDITPELRRAGLAREAVRLVQEARKTGGLDVSDRITLWWQAADPAGPLAQALREQAGLVAEEVLATAFVEGSPDGSCNGSPERDLPEQGDAELGLRFWLRRA